MRLVATILLLLLPAVASAEGIVNVTSTARDAFATPLEIGGIYNRTTNALQVWDGTGWKTVLISGGVLGTPLSGTLSNCSGLPISTGISGMASGAATFLATPSRTNANSLLSDADFLTTGAAEISGLTEKTTPHDDDWLLIEDSEASNAKKKLKVSNLPSGGGGGSGDIESVTAGDGLTGGGTTGAVTLNVGPGLALDVQADQIDFDPTELNGSRTWGDGSTDTIVWTFDRATGTDPTITFNSGSIGFQAITLGTALAASSGGTGLTSLSANTVTFLGAADYAAMRTQLGLVIGTNVQAFDSDLSTYAGITPSANIQSLLASADYAAARTNLGLAIGTNVQAYDADLASWAGVTRASGFDTFTATPSGANLASLLTSALPTSKGGTGATSFTASRPVVSDSSGNLASVGTPTITTYSAGTAASLTDTPALLDFGTTDPSITITAAGTYRIEFGVNLAYVDATTDNGQKTVTLKLRRTNNTAADLTNGTLTLLTPEVFNSYYTTWGTFHWVVEYTTSNTDDVISVFGSLNAAISSGNINATQAYIRATRIY